MEKSIEDLKQIRSMMERSTKFVSISGMSGVSAGIFALLGATAAYFVTFRGWKITRISLEADYLLIAGCVLILAAFSAYYFSRRKAHRSGSKFWTPVTWQILGDFMIPMVTGGIFCLVLMYHHRTNLAEAATLVFYGLALISAGRRTYKDVKILGLCEIVLGFISAFFPLYGLVFWAIGFGVLHILYGIVMHFRYDSKTRKG